jgi:hypothetical protein
LIAFAGSTATSKKRYTFNDYLTETKKDTQKLCGEKQLTFWLNGTESTYLFAENADFFYFNPPVDATIGKGEV